ncbi:hypothetical protein AVEN_154320-1, partial [Araneus ventricosus]
MARKNPWTYRRRKRRKKGKCSKQEEDVTVCSQLHDPGVPSNSIGIFSEISQNNPRKNEGLIGKDTMFQHSTMPLTTANQSETSNETFKRCSEDENATTSKKSKVSDSPKIIKRTISNDLIGEDAMLQHSTTPSTTECQLESSTDTFHRYIEDGNATTPKETKVSDSPKTIKRTISYDCFMIETPQTQAKDDVADSRPIVSILCSPLRSNYLEKRLPWKQSTLQGNDDLRIKVASSKNMCDVKADVVGAADKNYAAQANAE